MWSPLSRLITKWREANLRDAERDAVMTPAEKKKLNKWVCSTVQGAPYGWYMSCPVNMDDIDRRVVERKKALDLGLKNG